MSYDLRKRTKSVLQVCCFISVARTCQRGSEKTTKLYPSASFQRAEGKRRKMKICKYQNACKKISKKENRRPYIHLEDEYLAGKRAPYFICRLYPKCDRTDCPYVHFILPTSSSSASSDGCN